MRQLNYKVLYSPEENYTNLKRLIKKENDRGYHIAVGYSDIGAFFTPLSVMFIQNTVNTFRKNICDEVFGVYSVIKGLDKHIMPHINTKLKSYIDFNSDEFQVIIG